MSGPLLCHHCHAKLNRARAKPFTFTNWTKRTITVLVGPDCYRKLTGQRTTNDRRRAARGSGER